MAATGKPKFFYGYVIVAVAFIIMMLTFGLNYTFGVFFKPLLAEFGWTKAVTSAGYSLTTVVAGFWGIFAGRLTDRFGSKVVGIAGGCFLGLGFLLMSRIDAVWQFYLFFGIFIGIGSSVFVPLLSTVARWFARKRSTMTGVVVAGSGVASLLCRRS